MPGQDLPIRVVTRSLPRLPVFLSTRIQDKAVQRNSPHTLKEESVLPTFNKAGRLARGASMTAGQNSLTSEIARQPAANLFTNEESI